LTDLTIDAFLDAVGVAFGNAGTIVPWPMHVARISPFYSDIEAADLVGRLHAFRANGTGPAEIAALYPSASSAKSLMLDLIPGMKAAAVPAADRVDFVSTVFAGLAEREQGDVFCRDGRHSLLANAEVADLVDSSDWTGMATSKGREMARAAFTLSGAAQSLVWSVHFYGWTDISFVIHGPYPVVDPDGNQATLVVRDFFDIAPGELWPGLPDPPARMIRLCSLHDHREVFSIDIFNHLLHCGPLLTSTRWISLSADGAQQNETGKLTSLTRALVAILRRQKEAIDALDERELAIKFVESRYYAFRKWRDQTGEGWRPDPEVYQRLRNLPMPGNPAEEPPWPVLRRIFDPRLDWA
jgi:hypothetical protein